MFKFRAIESNYLRFERLMWGNIPLTLIPAIVAIATTLVYYCGRNINLAIATVSTVILNFALAFVAKKLKLKINIWHVAIIVFTVSCILFQDTVVQAQILEQIQDAIDGVGQAAGGSFATTVLEAFIELLRIAIYIVVAGVVIAAIFAGVAQGQWQTPVLVVGVIAGIGLFLEIMGEVVFG